VRKLGVVYNQNARKPTKYRAFSRRPLTLGNRVNVALEPTELIAYPLLTILSLSAGASKMHRSGPMLAGRGRTTCGPGRRERFRPRITGSTTGHGEPSRFDTELGGRPGNQSAKSSVRSKSATEVRLKPVAPCEAQWEFRPDRAMWWLPWHRGIAVTSARGWHGPQVAQWRAATAIGSRCRWLTCWLPRKGTGRAIGRNRTCAARPGAIGLVIFA